MCIKYGQCEDFTGQCSISSVYSVWEVSRALRRDALSVCCSSCEIRSMCVIEWPGREVGY